MGRPPPSAERIGPLAEHDRAGFGCGVAALDRYFHMQAGQDSRRRIATCFVLIAGDGNVAGYYTLPATSILLAELPLAMTRKSPRYAAIPATLLGRLAVDRRYRGRKFGETLLFDAFARTLRSEIASFAIIVDAKDDDAASFYERYAFIALPNAGRRMFKPLVEIAALFG